MRRRGEWRRVLKRFRGSRLRLRAFAAAEGMNWRTLQHWKYVLGKEAVSGEQAGGGGGGDSSFVELRPTAVTVSDGRFEVEVGDRQK